MTDVETKFSESEYLDHIPVFENEASKIISFIKNLTPTELSQRINASASLGIKSSFLACEFPNKHLGNYALDAFSGEVFKALNPSSLSASQRIFALKHFKIVSSLYGILDPSNIIKSYRLDFNADCAPNGLSLNSFWKPILTTYFVKWLKENNVKEIVNLLPSEASKYFDWKIVKTFAEVVIPDFKTITDNATLKTPYAGKLKELRGIMARTIIEQEINSLKGIRGLSTSYFQADPEFSNGANLRFYSV